MSLLSWYNDFDEEDFYLNLEFENDDQDCPISTSARAIRGRFFLALVGNLPPEETIMDFYLKRVKGRDVISTFIRLYTKESLKQVPFCVLVFCCLAHFKAALIKLYFNFSTEVFKKSFWEETQSRGPGPDFYPLRRTLRCSETRVLGISSPIQTISTSGFRRWKLWEPGRTDGRPFRKWCLTVEQLLLRPAEPVSRLL